MIFYKYRTDSKNTENILTAGKVYLSTASGLNDPFECSLQEIGNEWIEEKVKELEQAGLLGFIMAAKKTIDNKESFFGLPFMETKQMLTKIKSFGNTDEACAYREKVMTKLTGHPPANSRKMFSEIDSQLLSVGIFSLSTNPIHPLMWAHYAGEHSGICLGFKKTEDSKFSNSEHFLPVIYSDKLPEMSDNGFNVSMAFSMDEKGSLYASSYKIAFSDKTFQKAITTKHTCWVYEEEWRYVEPYSGLFDWPGPITEIIFGLKCSEERQNHYIKITEENISYPVHLYKIRKKRGTNELEIVALETPISNPKISPTIIKEVNFNTQKLTEKEFSNKMERLIREEKYGDVLYQIDENLKTNPDSTLLLDLKGTAHGYAQEHKKALECFTKLTIKCPDIAVTWYQKACALTALKRHKEAVIALKQAYKLDPNDPSTAFNLGVELINAEADIKEALDYLERADYLGHRRAYSILSDIKKEYNNT
ncbi:MAG: hypothetical protein K0R51_1199 [Cytophagaceae bacterium]|jgi:hypothetical protein|nr:hypothetical protein [Cytophagaceae bacterium]